MAVQGLANIVRTNKCSEDASTKNYVRYPEWGGRGITVCAGFRDFPTFLSVLGNSPTNRHSIDRINNNASYTCGACDECLSKNWTLNVRWATPSQQTRNSRAAIMVEFEGKLVPLADLAESFGIVLNTLYNRIVRRKWPIEVALSATTKITGQRKFVPNSPNSV